MKEMRMNLIFVSQAVARKIAPLRKQGASEPAAKPAGVTSIFH